MLGSFKARRTLGGIVVIIVAVTALVASIGAGAGTTAKAAAPESATPPTITGKAVEGQALVGHRGKWTGTVVDYTDWWMRCDKDGGSCATISGQGDKNKYVLKNVDVGNTIRFRTEAKNADGATRELSVPTAVVAPATTPPPPPATNGCAKSGGTIPVAGVSAPARLNIDQTQVSPSTIGRGTQSVTVRLHVSACKGSVADALVYVTAVPYGQFSVPNEQRTGSDGWATLQFNGLAGFPVSSKQQLLVLFVRARKAGEPILGGVSSRRLVSFHVAAG